MQLIKKRDEKMNTFKKAFWNMELIDIYSSGLLSETRFRVAKELIQKGAREKDIKSIINPELRDEEVLRKKELWEEMRG